MSLDSTLTGGLWQDIRVFIFFILVPCLVVRAGDKMTFVLLDQFPGQRGYYVENASGFSIRSYNISIKLMACEISFPLGSVLALGFCKYQDCIKKRHTL